MNENIEATTTAQVNNSDHVERFLKKFLNIARIIKAHDPNVCAYVNIYQNGIIIDGVQVYVYDSADNLIVNIHNPNKYGSEEALINIVQRYEVIGETEANIFVNCGSDIKKCDRLIYALTKLQGIELKPEELSYSIISTYGHIDTDPNGACNRYNNVYEDIRLDADSNYRDPNISDENLIAHLESHRLLDVDTSINNVQGGDSGFNFQNIGRLLSIACGIFCILMATGVIDLFGSDDDDYKSSTRSRIITLSTPENDARIMSEKYKECDSSSEFDEWKEEFDEIFYRYVAERGEEQARRFVDNIDM